MRDLLSYILEQITGEKIEVEEDDSEGFTNFVIKVPQDKMGQVIGRGGKTINSIKNILKIKAIKEGVRIDIQVTEI